MVCRKSVIIILTDGMTYSYTTVQYIKRAAQSSCAALHFPIPIMQKIFFFDIDNTLLDHHTNQIPPSALDAIEAVKRAGHIVVIATGRGYGHAKEFIDVVKPSYTIIQNGARIMYGDELLESHSLNQSSLMQLFAFLNEKGISYGINDGLKGHVSATTPEVLNPMDSVEISFEQDLDFYKSTDCYQAWMFFDEQLDSTLLPQLIQNFPDFDYVRWHTTASDVLPKGINKMTGCEVVLQHAQVDVQHAYGFGDGLNDIQMLQGLGIGVAMGNAHPTLKALADRVAPHISENGLAQIVHEILEELAMPAI